MLKKNNLLSFAAFVFISKLGFADNITVCLNGKCDFDDPLEAMDFATAGDIIEISEGTYLLEETLVCKDGVHIQGAVDSDGNPTTTLDAQGLGQVLGAVYTNEGTMVENLVMINGVGEYGGGVRLAAADLIFRNCIIRDNHALWHGGGMYINLHSSITMIDCVIMNNIAQHPKWENNGFGGAFRFATNSGMFRLVDCTVTGNYADSGIGGIMGGSEGAPLILERTRVCGNTAPSTPQSGGGVITILGGCIEDDCDSCDVTVPADLNFDGIVNVTDLLILLDMWGSNGSADIDFSGVVDVSDLLILIGAWG